MTENKPDLLGLSDALTNHGRPSMLAFSLSEILRAADYSDEEIAELAESLLDIVS